MDFTNATIKYKNGVDGTSNACIKVTYPPVNGSIKSLSVPLDEANTDYQAILEWVAAGNTIEEAD
tara:strand:+ start:1092 stop:1286 length:195 start_codon:yes stop_codon:yes gene_type:complete